MKIYIAKPTAEKIGGGFTFIRNFQKGLAMFPKECEEVFDGKDADIILLPYPTVITFAQLEYLEKAKKERDFKIVLRLDGIPENWRNRGGGWPRMRDFSKRADAVIYQSAFVKETIGRLLGVNGIVIYNGVDTNLFKEKEGRKDKFGYPALLFVNYRKAENNKRIEEVIERFRYYKLDNPKAKITFVGLISKGQFLWNGKSWDLGMLDLKQDVDWRYLGGISEPEKMADIMQNADYITFPSFADPCPNTLIESLSCGCKPLWINDYGGQAEIVKNWDIIDWSLEGMTKKYLELFKTL